jgi:hypothetical protein
VRGAALKQSHDTGGRPEDIDNDTDGVRWIEPLFRENYYVYSHGCMMVLNEVVNIYSTPVLDADWVINAFSTRYC